MKKTVNVAIGGCCFTIDEDAYRALDTYLVKFKGALDSNSSKTEVMDELEARIADILKGRLGGREVVDLKMVQTIIEQIGYPQGYKETAAGSSADGGYHYSAQTERSLQENSSETLTDRSSQEYAQDLPSSLESM